MGIKPLSATEFSALIGIMSIAIAVFVHEASELLAVANGTRVAKG